MGMDGLSMSNTGMLREATSRDISMQTRDSIQRDDQNKQVDKLETQMKVKEDGHNGSGGQSSSKNNDDESATYEETSDVEGISSEKEDKLLISDEDLVNHSFYVKIDKSGNVFELYDKESNRLVEKIEAKEINQLMGKLNMASGILVNRSV